MPRRTICIVLLLLAHVLPSSARAQQQLDVSKVKELVKASGASYDGHRLSQTVFNDCDGYEISIDEKAGDRVHDTDRACPTDPDDGPPKPFFIVLDYLSARNSGDTISTLSMYTANAHIVPAERSLTQYTDYSVAEAWAAAIGSDIRVSEASISGDTIYLGAVIERNDWLTATGIDSLVYSPGTTIVVSSGKIVRIMRSNLDDDSWAALEKARESLEEWAKDHGFVEPE